MVEVRVAVEKLLYPKEKSCIDFTFLPAIKPIIRLRSKKTVNRIRSAEGLKPTTSMEKTSKDMVDKFYLA
jgi:hypothetical protein